MNTNDNTPAPDYGEPWRTEQLQGWRVVRSREGKIIADAMARDRAVACVNALAGVADPAAHLAAMREAIREAHEAIEEARAAIAYEAGTWRAVDPCLPKSSSAIAKLQPFLK
jgi:hypothetical protein